MGGLHLPANNPKLGNPEEPVSWISYLDFNAMGRNDAAHAQRPLRHGPAGRKRSKASWLHETCLSSLNWKSDAEKASWTTTFPGAA